jgi:hypothetical protein
MIEYFITFRRVDYRKFQNKLMTTISVAGNDEEKVFNACARAKPVTVS